MALFDLVNLVLAEVRYDGWTAVAELPYLYKPFSTAWFF
jgi:hypothetical protein